MDELGAAYGLLLQDPDLRRGGLADADARRSRRARPQRPWRWPAAAARQAAAGWGARHRLSQLLRAAAARVEPPPQVPVTRGGAP